MKCPMCGNELRRSEEDPSKCLCDSCKVMFDWKDENSEEYTNYSDYSSTLEDYGVNRASLSEHRPVHKTKGKGLKVALVIVGLCFMFLLGFAGGAFTILVKLSGGVNNAVAMITQNGAILSSTSESKVANNDDGIIDLTTDDFKIKYIKHEFSKDYDGNQCLLYYYEYTNTSDENCAAGVATNVQCFQNGVECEPAFLDEYNSSMDNYLLKEVQPGGTVEVCQAYSLKDDSELTIEASAFLSLDDLKDVQKISVE